MLHHRCLTEFWICLAFWIYLCSACARWIVDCGLIHWGKQLSKQIFFPAEEDSVWIRKKSVRVNSTDHDLLLAFCNTSSDFHMEKTDISLPVFPSRINLKLHNISVTPKMVKKVIMNLHLSKASGPDCIPVVVLKNCEPELSYILAELFNKCLKESCFPDCWKVSSVWSLYLRIIGKGLQLKTTALLVFFL